MVRRDKLRFDLAVMQDFALPKRDLPRSTKALSEIATEKKERRPISLVCTAVLSRLQRWERFFT